MKFERKTITLPDDLLSFGLERAEREAKKTHSKPNLSLYVRDLIIKDKKRFETETKRGK